MYETQGQQQKYKSNWWTPEILSWTNHRKFATLVVYVSYVFVMR